MGTKRPRVLRWIIRTMKDRGIHAAALQEAWAAVPSGRDNDETDGFLSEEGANDAG